MKIIFDLDGVLRDLCVYFKEKYNIPYPKKWYWEFKGKDIFYWAKLDNYCVAREAPSTGYLDVVKKYVACPEIWTHQIDEWKPHTLEWLHKHIGRFDVRFMSGEEKRERLTKSNGCLLIEDSPLFTSYDKIILIDRPYNRHIKNVHRVSSPQELEALLLPLGGIR